MESPDYENEISGKEWYGLGEANERTDQALEVAKGIDNLDPAFIEYMNQVREYLNTAKADNDYRSFLKAMGMLIRLDDTITEKSNLDLFKENRQKPSGSRPETKIGQFIWELEGMKGKEMDLESLDTHLTVTSDEGKSLFADYEDKDWETLKDGNQLTLSYEIEGETVKVWIEIVDDHGISSKTGAKIIDWEIQ
ncbi:hypothetical protein [Novibacillus thermophilus]|uniref:Uncharacterized protein n=1 Tax=Novibacillus thermophilus TaxID=1471761 RepID=A0A1U9K3F8_9BACL|nr:hypothetical protein [Novibacillus thermophilus]AQS54572.1 hypothetical protein B0W44_00960 [Novibacillus thermophilus]